MPSPTFAQRFLLILLAAGISASATAQTASPPVSQRVDITFSMGAARPAVVLDEPGGLRTRPIATETGDSYVALTQDIAARVWWTRRLSTIVGFGWSSTPQREYDYARPPQPPPPPFGSYRSHEEVSYHNKLVSIAQGWDLPLRKSIVPFIAGGVEHRWVRREGETRFIVYSTSAPSGPPSGQDHSGTETSVFAAAGVRFLVGRYAVMSVEGTLFLMNSASELVNVTIASGTKSPFGHIPARWRVGAGVRF